MNASEINCVLHRRRPRPRRKLGGGGVVLLLMMDACVMSESVTCARTTLRRASTDILEVRFIKVDRNGCCDSIHHSSKKM
jgi:hypothetical protein